MRYLSLFSGIEAASVAWEPLGWKPVAFSEIDPFCCRLLKAKWPDVPNLGDVRNVTFRSFREPFDVLVGGSPCQSFSVAGQRAGMEGESGLVNEYIRILGEYRPKVFVWENVPGCISSKGGRDFEEIINRFQDAGYFIDADILDAKDFGTPQRRRRLFICGVRADLLLRKTVFSAITITKCLQVLLANVSKELFIKSEKELKNSGLQDLVSDGLKRKILWSLKHGTGTDGLMSWPDVLEGVFQKLAQELKSSGSLHGDIAPSVRQGDLLMALLTESRFGLTAGSLKKSLGESLSLMKLFTTSTGTKITIPQTICMFSLGVLNMLKLTCLLRRCYPAFYPEGKLDLTPLQGFMNYAKQAIRKTSGTSECYDYWSDFIQQAERLKRLIGVLGDGTAAGKILFEPESLCGDFAPLGHEGAEDRCGAKADPDGTGRAVYRGYHGSAVRSSVCPTITRRVSSAPDVLIIDTQANRGVREYRGTCPALTKCMGTGGNNVPAVINVYNETGTHTYKPGELCSAIRATVSNGGGSSTLIGTKRLRRLTPEECERLMGLPTGYTAILYRGKPAPDSQRYKALGNSMAVPVMAWIGRRIEKVMGGE